MFSVSTKRGVSRSSPSQLWQNKSSLGVTCFSLGIFWELLFSLFGATWIMSGSVQEMLLGWKCAFVGKRRKKVWQTTPSCLFWTVWKARNRIAFKDDFLSI